MYFITVSLTDRDHFAPMEDPSTAAATEGSARRRFTRPFRINRAVAREVPQAEDSLLVAMAECTGSPANR